MMTSSEIQAAAQRPRPRLLAALAPRDRLQPQGVWILNILLIGLAYGLTYFLLPWLLSTETRFYLAQPLLWAGVALSASLLLKLPGQQPPRLSWPLAQLAGLIGVTQVAVFALAGLGLGFGASPYGHAPFVVLGNLTYAGTLLVGVEMSRAGLLQVFGRRRPLVAAALAALLFTLVTLPPARVVSLMEPGFLLRFSGQDLLPAFAENLLAGFLCLLGGPWAALLYRAPLAAFEWLCPILPNLHWMVTALLGTLSPLLALVYLRERFLPAPMEADPPRAGSLSSTWVAVGVATVAAIWLNTGLLGIQPTLISGVSMRPTLQAGDVVMVQNVAPESVQVGDVIRFRSGEVYILHRVKAIQTEAGERRFLTRGDANNVDDPWLPASHLEGRMLFAVPKVGWLGLWVRQWFTGA